MKKNLLFLLLPMLLLSMHSMAASKAGAAAIKAGNILHCFDWKFTDIQAELDNIKAAGFVTVQTSVAQKNSGGQQKWNDIYRPWDTSVGNGLGSAAELKALCDAAHAKGMYVIVDVVANHTDGPADPPSPYKDVTEFWKNTDLYHNNGGANDGSRFMVTHGHIGMPDLKTEDSRVQAKYKEYVQALKGYGVDGIRWDAAKHIGLPSEGDQFWPSVIDADMYNYGEILNTTGGNNTQCLKEYHNYMSVTDNQYSTNQVLGAFKNGNVPNNGGCWTFDTGSDKFVYWGESHDTYLNDGDASQNVAQSVIDRAYAIAAAYNNIPGLYLSRPTKPAYVGVKGSLNFKNSWVAEVNKMKNECVGQRSYYVSSNGVGAVLRESGAVIVKGSGSGQISINNGGSTLAAGTYTDHVSGGTFTVTSSSISGNIGQNGIAVLYEEQTPTPKASINPNGGSFTTETLSVTVTGQNCTSVWYKIGSGSKQTKTGKTATFTIGSGVNYGQTITVQYGASDGQTESNASATFTKKDASAVQKIYVKNAANWSAVYAYVYKDETSHVAGWPGEAMSAVSGSKCYDYEYTLPEGYENCYVIFTESSTATDHRYPADRQPGLTFSGTDMVFNNSTNGWAAYDPTNCGGDTPNPPAPSDEFCLSNSNEVNVWVIKPEIWKVDEINIYGWGASNLGALNNWPGVPMTKVKDGVYKYTFTGSLPTGIKFNNTSTSPHTQSTDVTLEKNAVYEWNGENCNVDNTVFKVREVVSAICGATGIENVNVNENDAQSANENANVKKVLREGQLMIIVGEHVYSTTGVLLR